jgi:type I restriction enzyme, R subunit
MEGNEAIFSRVMGDEAFRKAAREHIAREVYDRIRGQKGADLA